MPSDRKRYLWLLIIPVAFAVYSTSFDDFPILEKRHSILAEADAACFTLVMRDFHLEKRYGNPYNKVNRNLGDVAQKHKNHHILYFLATHPIYVFLSEVYQALGITSLRPEYSVNALLACINIGLLFHLLARNAGGGRFSGCFAGLYAVSLSTWIYGSVPESWTFSTTLALLFLVLFRAMRDRYVLLAMYIGIAMLNNIFLSTLALFIFLDLAHRSASVKGFVSRSTAVCLVAVATWVVLMTSLSVFDEGFTPANYLKYTVWFKKNIAPPIVITQSYFWKVSITNIFINSIVSNQANPNIPQEALLYTFRQSPLGIASTIVYLALVALAFYRTTLLYAARIREAGFGTALFGLPGFPMIAFCALWVLLAVLLDPAGAFLYSSLTVPLMMILYSEFLDMDRNLDKYLVHATGIMVLANNSVQIMKFRNALAAMI